MDAEPLVELTVIQRNSPPSRLTLRQPTITLGRSNDCTVPIRDRFLSRHHAEISFDGSRWLVRDCGSVNGTLLNGAKLTEVSALTPGDRLAFGDTEIVFQSESDTSRVIQLDDSSQATRFAIPLQKMVEDDLAQSREPERARVLNALAIEFIADRSMSDLFEFILDRLVELLSPSRAALALLAADGKTFSEVRMRRRDPSDSRDLAISRTLMAEVIDGRKVVSFFDGDAGGLLGAAVSIINQRIRAAVCAPLVVDDKVHGVLYLDFLADHSVSDSDVRLIAQIARFGSVKLENTRLREESLAKAKLDEELRTAYAIQSRLLPHSLPSIDGYDLAGTNSPCATVSGDYYDVVVRPDGRLYFIVADVSGKGITAALIMSGLATAFNIFTRSDPSPAALLKDINDTMAPKTAPTKFATVFAGVLDPRSGRIDFANAGHVPPLVLRKSGTETLRTTDLVVGLFPTAAYRNQEVDLGAGDSLVLFTDGVTEAENEDEVQFGTNRLIERFATTHGERSIDILETIEKTVHEYTSGKPPIDDVTILVLTRQA